ncbi:MAG TPA: polysaccharide biosynthesis tyrosine autokinase [Candidatus Acidoferrales bacterium]|nr:polysaccharide biosynthesis tyrosine autokinase [Candidatus Acidoferrales bacterium]
MHDIILNHSPLADRPYMSPEGYPLRATGYGFRAHDDNLQWKRFMRTLQKQWRVITRFMTIFLVVLAVIVFFMTDTYEATARIEIAPPATPEAVSLNEQPEQASSSSADYFQTQLEILKGDGLALSVIHNLHLEQNPEIAGQEHILPLWSNLKGELGFKSDPDTVGQMVKNFEDRLSVSQIHNSELVAISFASKNPELSAQVTNNLIDTYLQRARRSQYDATMAAAGALSGELNDLKMAVAKANQALTDYQTEHGIVDTGAVNGADGNNLQGGPQNPVTARVVELNHELTQAEADRLNQQSYLRMVQGGNTASLPQMRDNVVLQDLEKHLAESQADLSQALAVYGQKNPIVLKLKNETNELQKQTDLERQRVLSQVKTAYNAATAHETLLRNTLNEMKVNLDQADQSMVQYNLLKQEAAAKSNLYVTLESRLKEIAISSSLFANNLRVIEHARVPESPARPQRVEIMALGFVFSLLAGCALAFVRENFDDTVASIDDIRDWTGLPCLGIVPRIGPPNMPALRADAKLLGQPRKSLHGARSRFFIDRPGSPEAEAMHSLDTAIRLPVRVEGDPRQVLVIGSSFPSEGKTTIAMNLAMALSRHGSTCLVDADLRNPQVARSFGMGTMKGGLREVLGKSLSLDDALQVAPRLDKLMILPAGSAPPDPVELLASSQMRDLVAQLRNKFLYVVIDVPPVIPYADSRWLSCLADGVVLVARAGTTTRQAMSLSTEILRELRVPVLGVVLNGVDLKTEYYWYGYGNDARTKTA